MESTKNIRKKINSPFGRYFTSLEKIDGDLKNSKEFGSILILSLVEEVGEMAEHTLLNTAANRPILQPKMMKHMSRN